MPVVPDYYAGWADGLDSCCHKCNKGKTKDIGDGFEVPISGLIMVLCLTCGNKRCPKASDHELECTGSNKSGQKGSIYEDC